MANRFKILWKLGWLTLVRCSDTVRASSNGPRNQAHAFHSATGKIDAKATRPRNLSRCVSFAFGSLGLRADGPPDPFRYGMGTILHPREAGNGHCVRQVSRERLEKRTG